MILKKTIHHLATLGLPAGTKFCGTIASLFTAYAFLGFYLAVGASVVAWELCVAVVLIALLIVSMALPDYVEQDPQAICLDEVAGMVVSFCLLKINLLTIIFGFILFRFFDGTKVLGIKYIEQLPGAWGVVLDDVVAGIYTNLGLRLLWWVILFFN